jgi:hypothetical protein
MRRTISVLAFSAVLATGAASYTLLPEGPHPTPPAMATFHVPANDGYGVGECLSSGSPCGRVIADAWCEAQGYVRATEFGTAAADEVTGSVVLVSTGASERPVAITCTR